MAVGQVGARIEGDIFQGMVFWWHAAMLLRPSSRVERVTIEDDKASGVDDLSIYYSKPGISDAGRVCTADYYQVKYHVDHSSEYAADTFCDPAFINATRSLLQRFHDAHSRLGSENEWYRLHLLSNWRWSRDDQLGPALRLSDDGALPDRFFSEGPKSQLGSIRKMWREHLGMTDEQFETFARRLRLRVDYLSRRELRESLNERLINVGLKEIPGDKVQNIYDSLTQQILTNRQNSFDRETFRDFCEREELFASAPPSGPPRLGIRSFMRCAECMEDECSTFVCVADKFDGRHIRVDGSWQSAVAPKVVDYLRDATPWLRKSEHHLLLDCHSSLAFLAGYELDKKSGALVYPVQKGARTSVWMPGGTCAAQPSEWQAIEHDAFAGSCDIAVVVSISRDAFADADAYIRSNLNVSVIVDARPQSGVGQQAVANADHALALSDRFADLVRASRRAPAGTMHLFFAAPNAFAFFLGQHRDALGTVQLYEFDFGQTGDGSYKPSILLPLRTSSPTISSAE